jgi:hypothetical protein
VKALGSNDEATLDCKLKPKFRITGEQMWKRIERWGWRKETFQTINNKKVKKHVGPLDWKFRCSLYHQLLGIDELYEKDVVPVVSNDACQRGVCLKGGTIMWNQKDMKLPGFKGHKMVEKTGASLSKNIGERDYDDYRGFSHWNQSWDEDHRRSRLRKWMDRRWNRW